MIKSHVSGITGWVGYCAVRVVESATKEQRNESLEILAELVKISALVAGGQLYGRTKQHTTLVGDPPKIEMQAVQQYQGVSEELFFSSSMPRASMPPKVRRALAGTLRVDSH